MAIHFKLIKTPSGTKPVELRKQFDESGGYVGRAAINDWVLKDPDRFLSARHCQISFKDGQFFLTDLSTNGTFINGESEAVGRGVQAPLHDGDTIDLGEYRLKVSIDEAQERQPAPVTPFPRLDLIEVEEQALSDKVSPSTEAGSGDLIGTAEPDSRFGPLKQQSPSPPLRDPLGTAVRKTDAEPPKPAFGADVLKSAFVWPFPKQVPKSSGSVSPDSKSVDSKSVDTGSPDKNGDTAEKGPVLVPSRERPSREGERAKTPAAEAPSSSWPRNRATPPLRVVDNTGDNRDPERALLTALGFKNTLLTESQSYLVHQTVGILLRECVGGLLQVLRSRASIKNEFRMNITTIQQVENNPLKFSANVDEVLETMFLRRSKAYQKPVEAVQEGFDAISDHQLAMIAGIRSAFRSALGKFDPLVLEEEFKRKSKWRWFNRFGYWKAYRDHYQSVLKDTERSYQELFGDEFVQAYEDQLRKLEIARKKKN